jgi:uncharacterized protein involved in response to NO
MGIALAKISDTFVQQSWVCVMSQLCVEIMFIAQVLEFLHLEVVFSIMIWVYNVGAIYLAQNAASGPRTKHVDVCYFVCVSILKKVWSK